MDQSIPIAVFWVCGFLLAISAIEHYLGRSRVPTVTWLLLAGVAYGAATHWVGLPRVRLHPEVVLYVFLPILIFDSARKLRLPELRAVGVEAGFFATVGLGVSTAIIGLPLAWLTELPLLDALLLGAALSATDPIAVAALLGRFRVPERLRTLVEAESLLNDGTTVVLFGLLAASIIDDMPISIEHSLIDFVWQTVGAVVVGLAIGGAGGLLLRYWKSLHDRFIGALIPPVTVYLAFGLADHVVHASGVIAAMGATLALITLHRRAQRRTPDAPEADRFVQGFWDFLGHLANDVLFFMLGAEIGRHSFGLAWWLVILLVAVLLAARSVTVYAGSALLGLAGWRIPLPWQHIVNLAGLKGAVSVALLLLISEEYPYRAHLLCAAFALVLFTLIANSVAMQVYLSRTTLPEVE